MDLVPPDAATAGPAASTDDAGSHVAAGGLRRGVFGIAAGLALGLVARLVLPDRVRRGVDVGGPGGGR